MKNPLILVCLICATTGAQAETMRDWGTSGSWLIRIDPSNGDGCLMQRTYSSGTLLEIGYVPKDKGAFLTAFNPAWTQIEVGKTGSLLLDFEASRFQGDVQAIERDGVPGGYAFFDNPEFASEFGRRLSVTLTGSGGTSEKIDLAGSKRALSEVKKCQDAQTK